MYGFQAPYAHNYGRSTQNGFGGINANKYADNGEVLSLLDMTSEEYPLLATRPQRWRCGVYEGSIIGYGVSNGKIAYVTKSGSTYTFCYAGHEFEFTTEGTPPKISIAAIGDYIILLPVMKYFDIRSLSVKAIRGEDFNANFTDSGVFKRIINITIDGQQTGYTFSEGEIFRVLPLESPAGSLNSHPQGMYRYEKGRAVFIGDQFGDMRDRIECQIIIKNGTYAGEAATGNVLKFDPQITTDIALCRNAFRAGDAVKISGCTHEQCNKTVVIREIEGNELIFYDNTFEMPEGVTSFTETSAVVERDIPDLDVVFTHNNRVWGAKGRNIYCSKAGDPLIWSDYESLADGCWWADSGSTETYGITGGYSYTYPRFFSEEHIYTIYGDTPEDFTIVPTQAQGTAYGCGDSFAIVNGMLIYLSVSGFMAYTGSLPQKIDRAIGNKKIVTAKSVSDGMKYYTFAWSEDGNHFYVFDAELSLWHEERYPGTIEALWHTQNTFAAYGGHFWTIGKLKTYEKPVDVGETGGYYGDEPIGKVKFADFTMDTVNKKQLKEIIIRHDVGGEVTVKLYIDDVLDSSFTRTLTGAGKMTTVLPCVPKRCDHWRLELEGKGPWVIYSIAASYIEGSVKK